jgi:predicted nucleic acid-binding Zn ribbon protein
MARKSLGFVPLIWECPFCNTQNPGPIKSCTSCGAPQPDDVEFLQVDEEKFNFIKDEALIRMAKAGPDIHCPYCGTRNPSTAKLCSQCGGDLSLGGKARATGQRVRTISEASAEEQPPVTAPTPSPTPPLTQAGPSAVAPNKKLSPILIIVPILVIIACLIGAYFLFFKSEEINATVTDVQWERSIVIEAYRQSTVRDWWDQIPESAEVLSCSEEYRYTSDSWEPNSTEVCGETYVEDTGTGVGEVVQDCTYDVYDQYCEYTVMEWQPIRTETESGTDLNPFWPTVNLAADERASTETETYLIIFATSKRDYTYSTSDLGLFLEATPGSSWVIEVNEVGGILDLHPSY